MAGIERKFDSLRFNRLETDRLTLALLVSLALHLFVWGGYEANKLRERLYPHAKIKAVPQAQPLVQNPETEIFMDTDQSSPDAPPNAKYYSDKNSHAAGQKSDNDTEIPKLAGREMEMMKIGEAPRLEASPAQPPPETQLAKNDAPQLKPGDWSMMKPQDSPEQKNNPEPPRPRTLKAAREQKSGLMPGPQSQTDGGTRRISIDPSFDVKSTPFGDYDRKFIDAVTDHWYDLLDSQRFALDRSGKVTLRFHLNYDGTISDIEVLENTVGELLSYVCRAALTDPAPFEKWPSDMRRMVGANFREITFTFYYY
ncbi:MAG TPA: hypothetical protein VII71_04445 [Verrucomicrobiae bacterium]